jgi:hypothetical protein
VLVWLAAAHVQAGEIDEATERLRQADNVRSLAQRPLRDQVRSLVLAESERWDEAEVFLHDSRGYAGDAGLLALPIHLDRLEGRATLARGRTHEGIRMLAEAARAFTGLGAVWDASLTELLLAEALTEANRPDEGRMHAIRAVEVFERLRARAELNRARALLASLGG